MEQVDESFRITYEYTRRLIERDSFAVESIIHIASHQYWNPEFGQGPGKHGFQSRDLHTINATCTLAPRCETLEKGASGIRARLQS